MGKTIPTNPAFHGTLEQRVAFLRENPVNGKRPSFSEIGRILSITADKAQKLYKKVAVYETPVRQIKIGAPLEVAGDIIVVADIHVNSTQYPLLEKVCKASRKFAIKRLAIAGDLFNFDVFSHWPQTGWESTFSMEIASARSILSFLMGSFNEVYYFRGNHDERFMRKLDGQANMETLADLIAPEGKRGQVITSDFNYMYVDTKRGRWMLAHQFQYSRNKMIIGKQLATKYQCHVVTHHQHHCSVGLSDCGRYTVADNGCLADPDATPYKALNANTMPNWGLGFGVISKGHWHPYVEGGNWGIAL